MYYLDLFMFSSELEGDKVEGSSFAKHSVKVEKVLVVHGVVVLQKGVLKN
jgi:hypothetical protein